MAWAQRWKNNCANPAWLAMSFEERLALLVDREIHCRSDRKLARLLKQACLKYPQAAIEDIGSRPSRGIDRRTDHALSRLWARCVRLNPNMRLMGRM